METQCFCSFIRSTETSSSNFSRVDLTDYDKMLLVWLEASGLICPMWLNHRPVTEQLMDCTLDFQVSEESVNSLDLSFFQGSSVKRDSWIDMLSFILEKEMQAESWCTQLESVLRLEKIYSKRLGARGGAIAADTLVVWANSGRWHKAQT